MGTSPGVQLTTLQILLGLFTLAATGFGVWLYRHETWFRNVVFPVVQVLTGENPTGRELPSDGHIEEADDRLTQLEQNVDQIRRTQKRQNREIMGFLRRITESVEGLDAEEFEEREFFPEQDPGSRYTGGDD